MVICCVKNRSSGFVILDLQSINTLRCRKQRVCGLGLVLELGFGLFSGFNDVMSVWQLETSNDCRLLAYVIAVSLCTLLIRDLKQ